MGSKLPESQPANVFNSTFDSDEEAIRVLKQEARKLKLIALKEWRRDMASYKPKMYVRTRKAQNSIQVKPIVKLDANEWGIEVTYENDLAYHDSIIAKDNPKGHAIMLMSEGWFSKKLVQKKGAIYRYSYFDGTNYLSRVVKAYNAVKDPRIAIDVNWSGRYTDK